MLQHVLPFINICCELKDFNKKSPAEMGDLRRAGTGQRKLNNITTTDK